MPLPRPLSSAHPFRLPVNSPQPIPQPTTKGAKPRLAVVLKGYPRLSETFIAQELLELQERGYTFDKWSLRHPYDGGRTHPIHDRITAELRYLPEYLHDEPMRVFRAWLKARRLPGYSKAWSVWRRDLSRDWTRNRVRRWGQALVLAAELPSEVDLLYAHFLHTPASVTRYAAMMRGIPWGFSAHAKDIWTIPEWEKSEKIADAAFGVTCTGTGAEHLHGLDPTDAKIGLVYHGLDLGRFPDPPELRAPSDKLRLLSVGRLVAKKGYDDLLDALAEVDVDWHLTHIGGGELSDAMTARAAELGLSDRIEWRGKQAQDAVVAAMREADLFVLPSKIADDGDRDGLPNVLMEAASQKLPILSTDVSAIPEFIPDASFGTLVPPGDPKALAEALTQLAEDPAIRAAQAEAAFGRLTEAFGMTDGIDRLEARLAAAMARA